MVLMMSAKHVGSPTPLLPGIVWCESGLVIVQAVLLEH